MLQPVRDIDEYKRIKQTLRAKFDTERTGEHNLFIEQTKMLQPLIQPLIATQQQTVQAIQNRAGRPLAQLPAIMDDALGEATVKAVGPPAPLIKIDLDSGLDESDIKNLQDMHFDLPSEVFKTKQVEETLNKIKTENRSIGQKLGKGSDATE